MIYIQYAEKSTDVSSKLYGAKATINIWDPKVENKEIELSISQIWISSGGYETNNLNTIEVGWQVCYNFLNYITFKYF